MNCMFQWAKVHVLIRVWWCSYGVLWTSGGWFENHQGGLIYVQDEGIG